MKSRGQMRELSHSTTSQQVQTPPGTESTLQILPVDTSLLSPAGKDSCSPTLATAQSVRDCYD